MRTMLWMMVAASLLATPALADNDDARCQRAFRYVNSKCPEMLTGLSCKDTPDKVQAAYDRCHDGGGGGGGGGAKPAAPAPAQDNKKDSKPASNDAVRCTVTKVAGHDTSIAVSIASKMFPEDDCKANSFGEAAKWFAANAKCDAGATVYPFTVTFGAPGKEKTLNKTGACPKAK